MKALWCFIAESKLESFKVGSRPTISGMRTGEAVFLKSRDVRHLFCIRMGRGLQRCTLELPQVTLHAQEHKQTRKYRKIIRNALSALRFSMVHGQRSPQEGHGSAGSCCFFSCFCPALRNMLPHFSALLILHIQKSRCQNQWLTQKSTELSSSAQVF